MKQVAIIGAGSSGMAAAYALTNHPEKFRVIVFEKADVCGGVATSVPIDKEKFGADYVNDGVQGGSPQFFNTELLFKSLGFSSSDVSMQISFGRGVDQFWTNVFPSELVAKHEKNIKRFGKVLRTVKKLEVFFAVISVQSMLRLFRFPQDFGDRLVYPLIALFMGTGNQTPHVSSAILARLFLDPSMRLFEYSSSALLDSVPTMHAFPRLHDVYGAWRRRIEEKGAEVRTGCEVNCILRRGRQGVVVGWTPASSSGNPSEEKFQAFDDVIVATDADTALKILGDDATFSERKILGNVKYFWDISVTHWDKEYMKKYYQLTYDPSLVASSRQNEESTKEAMRKAEGKGEGQDKQGFEPLYFIHMYDSDPKKIEMSFDLTVYQPQFKSSIEDSADSSSGGDVDSNAKSTSPSPKPRVYQTIFLDEQLSHLWTKGDIDPSKIIFEKWWKQQGHNWTHYLGTVPWMWTLNGSSKGRLRGKLPKNAEKPGAIITDGQLSRKEKGKIWFAGAWGLVNMHEVGITSGFAAAYRLGADYPFNNNNDARRLFTIVLGVSHLQRMRKEDRKGFVV